MYKKNDTSLVRASDRKQVRKYLPIIEQVLTDYHNHTVEKWEHDIKL